MSLLQQIPNSPSGTGTLTCKTYSGATLIGTKQITFTLNAPASAVPTIGRLTLAEGTSAVASAVGKYVQGQSTLDWAITGAAGVQGSTIAAYELQVGSQAFTGQTGTTGAIADSGSVRVDLVAAVSSLLNGGVQKNALRYRTRAKVRDTTTWTDTAIVTPGGVTVSTGYVVAGPFDESLSYDVRVEVLDLFATSAAQAIVTVATVTMDWGDGTLAVGAFHQGLATFEVGGDAYIDGDVLATGNLAATGQFIEGGAVLAERYPRAGTTAERDAYWGVASNDAQRVALANKQVRWFNTDLGWEESLFAITGTSGLTALGLVGGAGIASGWYPVPGGGPGAQLYAANTQVFSSAANFTQWSSWGVGNSWKNTPGNASDGSSLIHRAASNAALQLFLPGRYRVTAGMGVTSGSGTGVISLRANAVGGADILVHMKPVPLLAGFGQIVEWSMPNVLIPAGGCVYLRSDAGTWSLGYTGTFISVEYVTPPLSNVA